MQVRIGLENGIEGRSLAWALDHPGCFAYGKDGPEAVVAMAQAVPRYIAWMEKHTLHPWFQPANIDLRLVETWECYHLGEDYSRADDGREINAWFQVFWNPLTGQDIDQGLQILAWSRADLLDLVRDLPAALLETRLPDERWPIQGVLRHVANAEWWYLDRLGMAGCAFDDMPVQVFDRLASQREQVYRVLPTLVGQDRVVGKEGEFWSPRKVLLRAAWHELDHTFHIARLIASML
jgi:hypothetical protein